MLCRLIPSPIFSTVTVHVMILVNLSEMVKSRGHDFLPLRRYFVGDKIREKAIVYSVLQPVPCSVASVPSCNTAVFSVSNDVTTIANDSGT